MLASGVIWETPARKRLAYDGDDFDGADYRGTSPIKNAYPPRTPLGP